MLRLSLVACVFLTAFVFVGCKEGLKEAKEEVKSIRKMEDLQKLKQMSRKKQ
jgi:hypothetical protein